MQISELKIPLENGLNKSPSEFEEAIRNGLTTLGIEHVTLVISSKPDFPAFKYIDGLSDGVSLTEVITDNLD
ncbi:LuxR family transcriptional regulator, partial [Vibrio sp. 10N.222.54.F6]